MSKKIMQFRYYGKDGGGKNYPEDIDDLNLSSGDIFYQHDCYVAEREIFNKKYQSTIA